MRSPSGVCCLARATRRVTLSPGRKVTAPPRLHMYQKAANGRNVTLMGDVACRPAGILGGEVQLEDRNNHIRPGRLPKLYSTVLSTRPNSQKSCARRPVSKKVKILVQQLFALTERDPVRVETRKQPGVDLRRALRVHIFRYQRRSGRAALNTIIDIRGARFCRVYINGARRAISDELLVKDSKRRICQGVLRVHMRPGERSAAPASTMALTAIGCGL